MPTYEIRTEDPDIDNFRIITVTAADADEAKYLADKQSREIAADTGEAPYKIAGRVRELK